MLYAILVFFIVGLVYSHLLQEFAPSVPPKLPVEVYELDYQDPQQFQEVCRVRLPVVILDPPADPSVLPNLQECMRQFPKQSVCIKNRLDFPQDTTGIDMPLHAAVRDLFTESDNSESSPSQYFTENNGTDPQGFLYKTGLDRLIAEEMDHALAPPMTMYKNYDWMTGGPGVATPLRYHTYNRKYLRVIEGPSIRVKLVPWSASRTSSPSRAFHHLYERRDYDTYTFISEIDLWNPSPTHRDVVDHMKDTGQMVEVELHCGQMLYVPPYWWYSIQYHTKEGPECNVGPDRFPPGRSSIVQGCDLRSLTGVSRRETTGLPSVVIEHTYATYMNRLASIGDLARHWLQRQTTTQVILRTFQGAISPPKEIVDSDHDQGGQGPLDRDIEGNIEAHTVDVSVPVPIPLQESIEIP